MPLHPILLYLDKSIRFRDYLSVGTNKKQYLMPSWPTLYPGLIDGKSNERIDTRPKDMIWIDGGEKDTACQDEALTGRQKQLLYECEEERMVIKACLRDLVRLKKSAKHTSWDTAEAANMALS